MDTILNQIRSNFKKAQIAKMEIKAFEDNKGNWKANLILRNKIVANINFKSKVDAYRMGCGADGNGELILVK